MLESAAIAPDEILDRARDLFERTIRSQVTDHPPTEYVVMDLETGDFEVGPDSLEVNRQLLARHPGARLLFGRYVGDEVSLKLGSAR